MSSKFKEAFDSLKSDENTKRERAERILSSKSAGDTLNSSPKAGAVSIAKERGIFSGKRGVALIVAMIIFISTVVVAVPVIILNNRNLLNAISLLKETFVDMDGVAAFGVWNAPEEGSDSTGISALSYVDTNPSNEVKRTVEKAVAYADTFINTADSTAVAFADENGGTLPEDWDEELYDWEKDYDWDPTKANVLIAINENGTISEVVYERTNGRGQVRQDVLGNAAAVYVSNGFTYVMYVNDQEWEFWKQINFAQEMRSPSGFHCHHEILQTVVIHNATGKVFALNDLIPQVSEVSGALNHTMQVVPYKEDFLYVRPMYGNEIPQWYSVVYDEESESIRYELLLASEEWQTKPFTRQYNVRAVRRDKFDQFYLLTGTANLGGDNEPPRISAGIVELPSFTRYDNAIIFSGTNGMMYGSDKRIYAFDQGKLKVFGENFELHPVEAGTEVAFEGIAAEAEGRYTAVNDGIAYKLTGGYLYSMFGEVWKVDEDGTLHERENLEGSFPRFSDDGYLIGGEIIAFVDTKQTEDGRASISGRMVQLSFDSTDDTPKAVITHIISASEISVRNHRMVVEQNEKPLSSKRGNTRYFLITVRDGRPVVDFFAYGYHGGVIGLTKPITEPLVLS